MTTDTVDPTSEMREAAARRAAAAAEPAADGQARSMTPGGEARSVDTTWMRRAGAAPMPQTMRAKKVERDGKAFYVVEGYATVYERGYQMWDWYGPYTEVVGAGAADDTLAANPDVVFLVNHKGLAMARTIAGTLELWSDETGMGDRAWLNPGRPDVQTLVMGIEDGTITEQSFAFMITSGRWSPDYMEYRIDAFDIDRGDTSAVNYGANPATSIAARAREILESLDQLPTGAARAALARLNHRTDLAQKTPVPQVPAQMTPTTAVPAQMTPTDRDAEAPEQPTEQRTGRLVSDVDAWLAKVADTTS